MPVKYVMYNIYIMYFTDCYFINIQNDNFSYIFVI